MTAVRPSNGAFKRAVYVSAGAHVLLLSFIILIAQPAAIRAKRDSIEYITAVMVGPGGGGNGGAGRSAGGPARIGHRPR